MRHIKFARGKTMTAIITGGNSVRSPTLVHGLLNKWSVQFYIGAALRAGADD